MKERQKKITGVAAIVAVIALLLAGCGSGAKPAASGPMQLDQAIAEAAARIDARIEAGSKIALLNFSSPSDRFSAYVLDELTGNLVDTGNLTVVDRAEVDLIRSEFEFQLSGEVGDSSMQELGQMLGAQSIVTGSLTHVGNDYRMVIRVLNVQSAAVAVQYRTDIVNSSRVKSLLEGGRSGGTATASGSRASTGGQRTQTGTASGEQAAPAQPAPAGPQLSAATAPQAGTYTFWPRLHVFKMGSHSDEWVYQVVVSGGNMMVYVGTMPSGPSRDERWGWGDSGVFLRNLDNKSRSWALAAYSRSPDFSVGSSIPSFTNVTGFRFSMHHPAGAVFEDIDLSKAQYEP